MVNVFKSVESAEEIVLVDAQYQDSGDEISSEIETSDVEILNLNMIYPIEYRVGSGEWKRLEPGTQNTQALDLSTTSIFVRRIRYTEPGYVRVRKTSTSVSLDVEGSGTDASLMLNGQAVGSTNGESSGLKTVSDTTYTILPEDSGYRLRFTSSSAVTVTVPSGLGAGFEVSVEQGGAGQITFSPSSTTINNYSSHTKTAGQYAVVALLGGAADVFTLTGQTGT